MSNSPQLSTRQYARIVHRWVEDAGLESGSYGTHTMRRTKASLIYRRNRNLRAVRLLLGHTKLESTVRYLGIEVDDALEIAEQTDFNRRGPLLDLRGSRSGQKQPRVEARSNVATDRQGRRYRRHCHATMACT